MSSLCYCAVVWSCCAASPEASWPGFRGEGNSRAREAATLPLTWSETQHVRWSCPLPGYGQSSPVVWKERAFVTATKGDDKETLVVAAVELATGKLAWTKEFPSTNKEKATDYVSRAAPTPLVDAKHVYAMFESGDLLALTHAGEVAWQRSLTKDYGPIKGNHGLGSSPAQTDEAVIVLVEHDGPSYLAALDKRDGRTLWKQDREKRVSWSSPIVAAGPQGAKIFVSSNGVAQAFESKQGTLLWEVTGVTGNTVASPTVTGDAVLIGSGNPGQSQLIRRGGKGNVAASHVAWKAETASSSFGSPLVHQDRAYFVSKAGVAYAVKLNSGEVLWNQRLPDSTWASPVGAGDRVYFFCKNGTTIVARAGDKYEPLAENKLTLDGRLYGVAVLSDAILIRGGNKLVCLGESK